MNESPRLHLSLNGDWRLTLDPNDSGKRDDWFDGCAPSEGFDVRVPSVWDLWAPDYDGVGWQFRDFTLSPEWKGHYVELHFDAVNYYAEVWLNGVRLGDHEGGYTPFSFDATSKIVEGTNHLAVRIVDPHGSEGYGDFDSKEIPCAKENQYWSFAGIWGDVSLIGKDKAHVKGVFIEPDIRRKRIAVTVDATQADEIRLVIEETSNETTGVPGRLVVEFPEFECWSPETPKLYILRCDLLRNGQVVDSVRTRFGMREFSVKENRFYLNNHPIFLKGVLLQPDYARSLAAPETREIARAELVQAKKAGFNMIRLHVKTAPQITLELADELGLMLYEEPPIGWIRKSPWLRERCEREIREMLLRDRNHPSVVIWGVLNETGNDAFVTRSGAQLLKDDLCALARSLDPSRLIIDDSAGSNVTREATRFMRPYCNELEAYDDLRIHQRAPVERDAELYCMHSGDPDRLYFLSEFGFGGMEDIEDVLAQYGEDATRLKDSRFLRAALDSIMEGFRERSLSSVFGDFSGFAAATRQLQIDAARLQFDACRANAKIAGYCYSQLSDAGRKFCAGALDRWRRPKDVVRTLAEAQRPMRPIIIAPKTNLAPREEIPVTVLLVNDERVEGQAELSLQVVGPTNQVLWKKKRRARIPRSGKELWEGAIAASGSPGVHRFVVRLMQGLKCIAENSIDINVFDPAEPSGIEVDILDPQGVWASKCFAFAKPTNIQASVHIVPPLANTIRAYPDNDLAQILAQVKDGSVAILFGPPNDWNDVAERIDPGVRATSRDEVGAISGAYHYVKLHPVFDGLPARCLMRQSYRSIAPLKSFIETSDEDICGSFNAAPALSVDFPNEDAQWWGSDILVRRHGNGLLVFTHLRILENLGQDPIADRLFVNMLKHFSRRSVPSEGLVPLDQKTVEWLRRERTESIHRWMLIGPFPNWGEKGHETAYPPESEISFEAAYPGWFNALTWKSWHSRSDDSHLIDLQEALTPMYQEYPSFDNGTAYAYAEFTCEKRQPVTLRIGVYNAMKVWLNDKLVYENQPQKPDDESGLATVDCVLKQGRNTVLVKTSRVPGPFKFSFDVGPSGKEPIQIKWWK
jgi:hypothetical protein